MLAEADSATSSGGQLDFDGLDPIGCAEAVDGPADDDLLVDLVQVGMDEVLTRALAVAGWSERAVHVFCWFSPPCETYSGMALGTLSNERWGGPQREGKDDAYRPVSGPRGAEARKADRLVARVMKWLHKHA